MAAKAPALYINAARPTDSEVLAQHDRRNKRNKEDIQHMAREEFVDQLVNLVGIKKAKRDDPTQSPTKTSTGRKLQPTQRLFKKITLENKIGYFPSNTKKRDKRTF